MESPQSMESSEQVAPELSEQEETKIPNVTSLEAYKKRKDAERAGRLPNTKEVINIITAFLNGTVPEYELEEKLWELSIKKALPLIKELQRNGDAISIKTAELEAAQKMHETLQNHIIETLYAADDDTEK